MVTVPGPPSLGWIHLRISSLGHRCWIPGLDRSLFSTHGSALARCQTPVPMGSPLDLHFWSPLPNPSLGYLWIPLWIFPFGHRRWKPLSWVPVRCTLDFLFWSPLPNSCGYSTYGLWIFWSPLLDPVLLGTCGLPFSISCWQALTEVGSWQMVCRGWQRLSEAARSRRRLGNCRRGRLGEACRG